MKICITSRRQETLELWKRLLPDSPSVEFVNENDAEIHSDVLVMSGIWAFERYGGRPSRDAAQILANTRGDGLPDWIVIPPFRPVIEHHGEVEIRSDFKSVSPAYYAVLTSLRAVWNEFGESCTVALDLPLLGMNDPSDEETPVSVRRAIEEFWEAPAPHER